MDEHIAQAMQIYRDAPAATNRAEQFLRANRRRIEGGSYPDFNEATWDRDIRALVFPDGSFVVSEPTLSSFTSYPADDRAERLKELAWGNRGALFVLVVIACAVIYCTI